MHNFDTKSRMLTNDPAVVDDGRRKQHTTHTFSSEHNEADFIKM